MKFKEHINSLKELIICKGCTLEISQETVNTIEELIVIIKRGEKYKKMWEKLRDIYLPDPKVDEGLLKRLMDGLEQKYFPKPVKKTITFTIEAPNEHYLGTAINDFEMFWAGYNGVKGHCIKYSYAKEGD